MTDPELVAKKLAVIESCVQELRTLARLDLLDRDVREQRFIQHTLQIAIQAAIDVASHIVSDERLGEPETNAELFDLLERSGWLTSEAGRTLRRMVGFRNIIVHGYQAVDLAIVRSIIEKHLEDLLDFVRTIRRRL